MPTLILSGVMSGPWACAPWLHSRRAGASQVTCVDIARRVHACPRRQQSRLDLAFDHPREARLVHLDVARDVAGGNEVVPAPLGVGQRNTKLARRQRPRTG